MRSATAPLAGSIGQATASSCGSPPRIGRIWRPCNPAGSGTRECVVEEGGEVAGRSRTHLAVSSIGRLLHQVLAR